MPLNYPTSIRIPAKLRQIIRAESVKEGRTAAQHIIYILTRWFTDRGVVIEDYKLATTRRGRRKAPPLPPIKPPARPLAMPTPPDTSNSFEPPTGPT